MEQIIKNGKIKNIIKINISLLLTFPLFILNNNSNDSFNFKTCRNKIKRVGVVNYPINLNVGNMLVKYSMFKKLEEMDVNATIIIPTLFNLGLNLSFLIETIKSHLLFVSRNFSELNEKDFDYLMVNSDQTWNPFFLGVYFNNVAFLKFAQNWKTKKFIYAASTGGYDDPFRKQDKKLIKSLLSNFTGISFREKVMVKILEDKIGLKSEFVLDPAFLLDKSNYLNIIKNYKSIFDKNDKFIFIYQLDKNYFIEKTIKKANEIYNFKVNKLQLNKSDYIESFIYGINNSQAIITDSFHGTVFSIIFNKPFIAFSNERRGKARFDSLKEIFHLGERIIEPSSYFNINISLLIEPLNLNITTLKQLKTFSFNYLKRNLDMNL